MSWDNVTFRCSKLGALMTEARSKSEVISETTKAYLIEKFVKEKYGREKEIESKYMKKGLQVEESSITLYSRVKKRLYEKNEKHFTNDFLSGTPDIVEPEIIPDVKSSWSIFTFFKERLNLLKGNLNQDYYWQAQGYMELTGVKKAVIVYCLIDTPQPLIEQEKRSLQYKMGVQDWATDANYQEACEELQKLMTYPDIPIEERHIEFPVAYDPDAIEKLYKRIGECRTWLNENFPITEATLNQK